MEVAGRVVVSNNRVVVAFRAASRRPVVGRVVGWVVDGRAANSRVPPNPYSMRLALAPAIRRRHCQKVMGHQHSTPDMVAPHSYNLAKSLWPQRLHSNTRTSLRALCRWVRSPMSDIRDHN